MSEDEQKQADEAESKMLQEQATNLCEYFDAVEILCVRHDGKLGTRIITKGSGSWHARYGAAKEYVLACEEAMRVQAQNKLAEE